MPAPRPRAMRPGPYLPVHIGDAIARADRCAHLKARKGAAHAL
ncbi:hypothetical protein [Streptomyces sp. NPDC026673]